MNNKITIRNANVCAKFTNFAGNAAKYNREGDRNFCINLTNEEAADLKEQYGLYMRYDTDDKGNEYNTLKINVSYNGYSEPDVYVVTGNDMIKYTKDELEMIDGYYITGKVVKTDLTFSPYRNKNRTDSYGYSAYLSAIYITLEDDPLAKEYEAYVNNGKGNDDEGTSW